MQKEKNILDCYNKTAANYASLFKDELQHKHLDRILLQSFAAENAGKGRMIDLGCGPGQTTKYLQECGVKDIIGTDLSPAMVQAAAALHPMLSFEAANMLRLQYADSSFGSAVAFYSIVHFDYDQVKNALKEIHRILSDNGAFLFSFHVGDNIIHLDHFLDNEVNIDFFFFEAAKITGLLAEAGFKLTDVMEREPYPDVEHQSRRAYIWASKAACK